MRKVHTSSQSLYVSRLPYRRGTKSLSLVTGWWCTIDEDKAHLELKSGLDVLVQALGDGLVKVSQDLHRQLRVDARAADQVVECIGQRKPDARIAESVLAHDHKATPRNKLVSTCCSGRARRKSVRRSPW